MEDMSMKMRSVLAALLALVMLLGVVGVAAADEKTTVSFWETFTDAQHEYLVKAAADFNASQDKYTVEIQQQPTKGFTSNVYTAVVNGVGPDIIFNYASEASKYVSAGLVANLDEYIYDEEIGIENFDEQLPEYLFSEINGFEDGHIHYLPGATTGPILYYNKTLFEELNLTVPSTWEDLVETCKAVKAAKGEDVLPFGIDSPIDLAQTLFLEAGYTYIDTENKCVGFAEGEKVAAWLGEQLTAGLFSKDAPSGGYFSDDFNTGKVAMYYGSCAGVPYIKPNGFEYAVAPAPSSTSEYKSYTIWNRGPIVFKYEGQDARAEGAYEFVKYLLATPEISEGWAEAMIAMTPWVAAQQVEGYEAFVASQSALAAVQARTDIAVSLPSVTGASECRDALKNLVVALQGGTEPATALADCVAVCNAALQGK